MFLYTCIIHYESYIYIYTYIRARNTSGLDGLMGSVILLSGRKAVRVSGKRFPKLVSFPVWQLDDIDWASRRGTSTAPLQTERPRVGRCTADEVKLLTSAFYYYWFQFHQDPKCLLVLGFLVTYRWAQGHCSRVPHTRNNEPPMEPLLLT